jgi:hypothetical protein
MVEQLFTATGEAEGSGKERTEQWFTARSEKRGNEETDRDRNGRERQRWRGMGL